MENKKEQIGDDSEMLKNIGIDPATHKAQEPMKKNRFLVEFNGLDIKPWFIKNATLPTFFSDGSYGKFTLNLYDAKIGDTTVSEEIYNSLVLKFQKENDPSIELNLCALDPTGIVLYKWLIQGVVDKIDFGSYDYSKDELVNIQLVIKPTNVVFSELP